MWFNARRRWSSRGYHEKEVDRAMDILEHTIDAYEQFTERVRTVSISSKAPSTMRLELQTALRSLEKQKAKGPQ